MKDLEGVTEGKATPVSAEGGAKRPSGKGRQKKIAVLTSGGDSAGMNAAGEYSSLEICREDFANRLKSELLSAKVLPVDVKRSLSEKDGKVSSVVIPPILHLPLHQALERPDLVLTHLHPIFNLPNPTQYPSPHFRLLSSSSFKLPTISSM